MRNTEETLPAPDGRTPTRHAPDATARDERRPISRRRRLARISRVLTCHGFGHLLGRYRLERLLPLHRGLLRHTIQEAPYGPPEHLRLAFEELGTAAIKLGQVLSTRPDLLPPAYVDELAKLRDRVPPVPVAAIRAEIEREFGKSVEELFSRFDDTPLAAASIGQVHTAQLPSGEEIVVKVQKPGVAEQVDVDLRLLRNLAQTAQHHSTLARDYDLIAIVDEFAWTLRNELDYEREGRNADTFRRQFADDPNVVVPVVHWSHTTRRVLTMQRLRGANIDDVEGLDRLGVDRHDLAVRSANLVLAQVFEHGFYHADPHPGNFLVQEGGAIGVLDFGMVGRIMGTTRLDLVDLMSAVVDQSPERAVDAFEALGVSGVEESRAALVRDVGHLLDYFVGRPANELRMDDLAESIFGLARGHQLRMPPELVLLLKALAMNDGVGRRLDPSFNLIEVAAPFARNAMRQHLQPAEWKPELRRGVADLARVGIELPGTLRRFTRRLDRGELTLRVQPHGLEEPLRQLEGMVNRLVLGMLTAAFVIGTGLVMVVYHPGQDAAWLAWFFWVGLGAVILLGLRLGFVVRRSGRR